MRTLIAIALGAALGAGGFALAQHEKHGDTAKVKSLLEQDVSEKIDGKEARVSVLEVSYGPGGFTPPHRHPGAVFGHVLEGELEAQLEGQPLRKLKAGDAFYVPPGHDSWVVGDEPYVSLHIMGSDEYAT